MNKKFSELITDINIKAQIAFALILIASLLAYIAFFK
jgi:hypothetical protein